VKETSRSLFEGGTGRRQKEKGRGVIMRLSFEVGGGVSAGPMDGGAFSSKQRGSEAQRTRQCEKKVGGLTWFRAEGTEEKKKTTKWGRDRHQ